MTNPQVAIDIVGNNLVNRGASQAEKRLDKLGSHAAGVGKKMGKIGDRRGLGNIARTFAEVDEAASSVFGNNSAFGAIGKRIGAVAKLGGALNSGLSRTSTSLGRVSTVGGMAASSLGTTALEGAAAAGGMEEAAAAAGGLAVAMGPVAVVGAAVVATLGAAAVAGYKFASGWAASTAQMGRFADTIGIAAKNLQELQGAGARYGIGADTTNSAIASFAQNAHDAYYARNPAVRVLLKRLGVGFSKNADGTLDYNKMFSDTSRGLAAQKDPQAALQAANMLGVAGMLPLLRTGPANLQAETNDIDKHGVVNSADDINTAKRFSRDGTMLGQMADRAKQASQAWTAGKYAPALESGVGLGQRATDGTLGASAIKALGIGAERLGSEITHSFAPAARSIGAAASKIEGAGEKLLQAAMAFFEGKGWSRNQAAGIVAGFNRESGLNPNARGDGGHARGVGQWHEDRQRNFARLFGHDISHSTREEQFAFADWELRNTERSAGRHLMRSSGAYGAGSAASRYYERPADRDGEADRRGRDAEALARAVPTPVKVEVVHVNAPAGTRTKVTHGASAQPAISYAMAGTH